MMRKLASYLLPLAFGPLLSAQTLPAERVADFNAEPAGGGETLQFSPVLPPLLQKAGAPTAYYGLFWEFGDGQFLFSSEKNVTHTYTRLGEYTASVEATNYYDDGKKPQKKRKTIKSGTPRNTGSAVAAASPLPGVYDAGSRQSIALRTSVQPKSGEELTCIISYRNLGSVTTDGRLHLFFNEKKFPSPHFRYLESRTHFGETPEATYSSVVSDLETEGLAALDFTVNRPNSNAVELQTSTFQFSPPIIAEEMLKTARGEFREAHTWRFNNLRTGESRNLFVSLNGTASMLRDTSATIHLAGVFEPFDPVLAPERFTLEVEIVASHDPNRISVSDSRVNYRAIGSKHLDYKVQFQNNGEGPASTVQIEVSVPGGLELAKMRPLDWYPRCPICPQTPTERSCLDTTLLIDGLRFTFRNIYLPGSRQEGVESIDSTRGFVRYRIEPERSMPKRAFRSIAQIVFDKNPPIRTNFSRTRFKRGISPGMKAGYGFDPDALREGYFFLGASVSPYKSWRIYPQLELLTGLRGRQDEGERMFQDTLLLENSTDVKFFEVRDSTVRSSRGLVAFEVPFLLRKNFNRWMGAGVGGSAKLLMDNGEDLLSVTKIRYRKVLGQTTTQVGPPVSASSSRNVSATRTQYTVFADLTLGAVRAGPNVGIRIGGLLSARDFQPFAQVSVEVKM